MTYIVRLLDPRAQALLDALVNMKMVELMPPPLSQKADLSDAQQAHLAGIASSLREVRAHQRGEIKLQTLDDFLKTLD
jgi:hypothetical protein